MVTFIITTCLQVHPQLLEPIDRGIISHLQHMRFLQYLDSIPAIIQFAKELGARVILVENNGKRETVFDTMGCDVLYTNNNSLNTQTKGTKELLDIWACIQHLEIPDDELIVKVSGRYRIDTNGNFCQELRKYNEQTTDCILRYGWYGEMENNAPQENCLTGLIAMKCKYVKAIQHNDSGVDARGIPECVEWNWARTSLTIDPARVIPIKGSIGYRMYEWNTTDFKDL